MRQFVIVSIFAGCCAACPASARSEVFLLKNGGRLEAEQLNAQRKPADPYLVRTEVGVRLALAPSLVQRVVVKTDVQKQYDELVVAVANTAEGHWQMAEWCKEAGLLDERKRHLTQVVTLEPDHEEARAALGYLLVGSRWMTQEEFFTSRGYVRSGGAWKLPQHIELEAADRDRELTEKKLRRDIHRWADQIVERKSTADEARRNLLNLRDPLAVPALAEVLADDDLPRDVRLLCLDQLAKLPAGPAAATLTRLAMDDKDGNIRDRCLDELKRGIPHGAAAFFVTQLTSKDNKRVNRAAECLERLGESEATLPLISALVTTHQYVVMPAGGGNGGIGFNSAGGFSVGGKPQKFKRDLQNSSVLAALVSLNPNVNHHYDEEAWRRWYNSQVTTSGVDLRRDD
jgi:HEAT repeat protein